MKWMYSGREKIIRCSGTEKQQKEILGYGGRVIERLKCPNCNILTFVDEAMRYDFCPHCGVKLRQYGDDENEN